MPSTFTSGRADLEKPSNGSFVDTWDVEVNANMDAIDACFSGGTTVTVSNANVTLSAAQMRCARIVTQGTLTANVTVFIPTAGVYVVANTASGGAFTVSFGGSGGGGTFTPTTGVHAMIFSDGTNAFSAAAGNADAVAATFVPPGAIMDFAMPVAPASWLLCDGSAISRTIYAPLFVNVGTTWGPGNGTTTFNLPNLQGQFRRGWDAGGTIDPARAFASLQTDEFKQHNHGTTEPNAGAGHKHTVPVVAGVNQAGFNNSSPLGGGGASVDTSFSVSGVTINNAGTASETRPKNYAVLTCIKT